MQPPRRSLLCPAHVRWVAVCICLLSVTACGRRGREAAQEKIRASHHAYTADDFVKAASDGDLALVNAYLQGGMDHNAADANGVTPLMAAAVAGKVDVVKALLDDNAKPDLANKDGSTALILAAEANQPEAVRALIEANADARLRDHANHTALLQAVVEGHDKVVDVLLATSRDQLARDGQLNRALTVAAVKGNAKIVTQLLEKGAAVNGTIEKKQTPLMFAATFGQREVVDLLLARGADPRLVDSDGANASLLAMQHGYPEVAKILDARAAGAPAPAATPGASPSAAPNAGAVAAASPTPNAAEEREKAWLKQQGIQPSALLSKDTGQDDDHDGFTNDEEIAAGTDPNDPQSHPPLYKKLRLARIEGDAFPVVFDGEGKGGKVSLSLLENGAEPRHVELEPGARIPGLPYKIDHLRSRSIAEKDTGRKLDVSELTLVNTDNNRRTVLVRGMASNSADARAVLHFALDGSDLTVTQGEKFALPGDPKTQYEVLDIRPTQVVLKIVGSTQTVTIEK